MRREVESLLAHETQAGEFIESPALEVAARMADGRASESPIGHDIGHYRVLSLLGAGGMGEVYLAQDTRLRRMVALKLLPEEFTRDRERVSRFEREARAASALNHPNILTIHEIGEAEAHQYIATEFVEGETLRRHLGNAPLKFQDALDIALQIASGLAAAHHAGIIHRDIKPENIMLRPDGLVKVLDFGLAKPTQQLASGVASTEVATQLTAETERGTVMGTARYMSPEQTRGLEVDQRTDIFSVGTVLYEMISGKAPFDGETPADIVASILVEKPPPLADLSTSLPPEFDRIIARCLEKDKERRYESAAELLVDLKNLKEDISATRLADGAPKAKLTRTPRRVVIPLAAAILALVGAASYLMIARGRNTVIDSVAVLPFANDTADPNLEYLSDGITDSITYSLSQLPSLKVKPHSAVFKYKGKEADAQTVGRNLDVQAIATGRIVRHGDGVTISAELIDVAANTVLWGQQYSRSLTDLVSVHEEISRQIAERLRLKLSGEEESRVSKRYSDNSEAYLLYLKGRYYWNKRTAEAVRRAVDYFNQATDKDPNYALAYSGVADSYNLFGTFDVGALAPGEAMPKAEEAARKALNLDNTLAEAHNSLAYAKLLYDWDWAGAESEFKQALDLKPNYADAHHWYSHYLVAVGRFGDSLAESRRALELDPLGLVMNSHLGWHYIYARQYLLAVEQLQNTIQIEPNYGLTHWHLALALEQLKSYDEATTEFRTARDLMKGNPTVEADLGHLYAVSDRRADAETMLGSLNQLSKQRYVSSYEIALIYAGLGQNDPALDWLEKACDEHADSLVYLAVEPRFTGLSSNPRFKNLLRRIHYPGS